MMPPYYSKDRAIVECYQETVRQAQATHELEHMLAERKRVLDERFVWTDEHICRLQVVNEKVDECLNHFKALQAKLPQWLNEQRSDDRAVFLNDFELCYQITPIVHWTDESGEAHEDEGIYAVLQSLIDHTVHLAIDYRSFEDSLHVKANDQDGYRMVTRGFDIDRLEGVYVSYAIHELSAHLDWSIQDILNISEFWGEVIVRGQHFAEIKQ